MSKLELKLETETAHLDMCVFNHAEVIITRKDGTRFVAYLSNADCGYAEGELKWKPLNKKQL